MLEAPAEVQFDWPPSSLEERKEAARWLDELLRGAPLDERLRRYRAAISTRLGELGFPAELGRYVVSLEPPIEPGRPGSWAPIPPPLDQAKEVQIAKVHHPCRITDHPALLIEHQQTEPWLLARALDELSWLERHRAAGNSDEAIKRALTLGHLVSEAQLVAKHEAVVVGSSAGLEALASSNAAKEARAANRHDYLGTRAKEIWAADPNRSIKEVAGMIFTVLPERNGKRLLEGEPVSEGTIRNLIAKLKQTRPKDTRPRARAPKK
jgi:hypothetical protein